MNCGDDSLGSFKEICSRFHNESQWRRVEKSLNHKSHSVQQSVVDWFGTWGPTAMAEVGREFTMRLDFGDAESTGGAFGIGAGEELMTKVEAFEGVSSGGFRKYTDV